MSPGDRNDAEPSCALVELVRGLNEDEEAEAVLPAIHAHCSGQDSAWIGRCRIPAYSPSPVTTKPRNRVAAASGVRSARRCASAVRRATIAKQAFARYHRAVPGRGVSSGNKRCHPAARESAKPRVIR